MEECARDILFDIALCFKLRKPLHFLDMLYAKFGMRDEILKKQVALYEVEAIDKPNAITIAVNPKEYLEKSRNKEVIKRHKGVRKGALGMDFDSYARRILLLDDHETKNKMLQ